MRISIVENRLLSGIKLTRLYRFYWPAWCLALSFLTVLPASIKVYPNRLFAVLLKLSINFYPLVGLVLGATLCAVMWLSSLLPIGLQAICILIAWVGITGALHLDGFGDAIDAAFAGHKHLGKKQHKKLMAVFKDSHIGAMAVIGLVLLLLLKYQLIVAHLHVEQRTSMVLILWVFTPFIARLGAIIYIQTTPYISSKGTLSLIYSTVSVPRHGTSIFIYIGCALCAAFLLSISGWFIFTLMCLCVVILCWRNYWYKKMGGYNGDCVGALIELIECTVLLLGLIVL